MNHFSVLPPVVIFSTYTFIIKQESSMNPTVLNLNDSCKTRHVVPVIISHLLIILSSSIRLAENPYFSVELFYNYLQLNEQ